MTGSWLKIETATPRKIEIILIADAMKCSRREAFAMCFEFWAWCDIELKDGHIKRLSLDAIDDAAGLPKGFCRSMADAGWLQVEADRIIVTNFMRHLGQTAKTRADGARRAAKCVTKRPLTKKC